MYSLVIVATPGVSVRDKKANSDEVKAVQNVRTTSKAYASENVLKARNVL
jgi:hypothetical protein